MKFFVSWTRRDPVFQEYDSNCNVLVSPANVRLNWMISKWVRLPSELFIDSGAYSIRKNNIPTCHQVLNRQIYMSKNWPQEKKLYFSHPDILLPLDANFQEKNHIFNLSIERAKIFFEIINKAETNGIPVGVIHGFDEESILTTYYELCDIGYKYFALGSVGIRMSKKREESKNAIRICLMYNIRPLHIFGISWPFSDNHLPLKISSFDTSAPTKLGFYGTVLYGCPPERYVIAPNADQKYHDRCFNFRKSISAPLPCKCPICSADPNLLISKYNTAANQNRAIHNYYQIKWAIENLK